MVLDVPSNPGHSVIREQGAALCLPHHGLAKLMLLVPVWFPALICSKLPRILQAQTLQNSFSSGSWDLALQLWISHPA